MNHPDGIVVGTGLVGMFAALELANQGMQVTLIDSKSPAELLDGLTAEVLLFRQYCPDGLEGLRQKSRECLSALIEKQTLGIVAESLTELQLVVAAADVEAAKEEVERLQKQGASVEYLSEIEVRQLDSGVSPEVKGALLHRDLMAVDSEALYRGLLKVCQAEGRISIRWGVQVLGVDVENGQAVGIRSSDGPFKAGHIVLSAGIGTVGLIASTGVQMPPVPEKTYRLVGQPIEGGQDRFISEYVSPDAVKYPVQSDEEGEFGVRLSVCFRTGRQTSLGDVREFVVVDDNGSSDRAALHELGRRFTTRMPGYKGLVFDRVVSRLDCFIPDALPIVGTAPNIEALYFAMYRRDHRDMLTPGLGDVAARTVIAGKTLEGMDQFSPQRFPQSAPGGRKKSFGE